MNELQLFNNSEFGSVRAIQQDGEPWFVGRQLSAQAAKSQSGKTAFSVGCVKTAFSGGARTTTTSQIKNISSKACLSSKRPYMTKTAYLLLRPRPR